MLSANAVKLKWESLANDCLRRWLARNYSPHAVCILNVFQGVLRRDCTKLILVSNLDLTVDTNNAALLAM